MTLPTFALRHQRATACLIVGAAAFGPAFAQPRPLPVQALEKRGVTIVGTLPNPGGLPAYAGYMGQEPMALYLTPDGKHVIVGKLFDAEGRDQTSTALAKLVAKPMSGGPWRQLESSHWIADGRNGARVVYVFTDPNCPYCNKLWTDARPWVAAGKVQLRHIIVGILTPTSAGKAAALLADKDPAATLAAYEGRNAAAAASAMASGRPRPLGDDGLKPLTNIAPAQQAQLQANEHLMASLGLQATPAIAWRDTTGALQVHEGLPEGGLAAILGPH